MADMSPIMAINQLLPSQTGQVKLYISNGNPEHLDIKGMQPAMIAEAPVCEMIQPVLEALADNYSPVQGMYFVGAGFYTYIFLDKKQRIYVHDNGYWMVKGHFDKAVAKDSKISWDVKEDDFLLSILAVMLFYTLQLIFNGLSFRPHLIILILFPHSLQLLSLNLRLRQWIALLQVN